MLLGQFGTIVYLCVYYRVIKKYYKLKMYMHRDIQEVLDEDYFLKEYSLSLMI